MFHNSIILILGLFVALELQISLIADTHTQSLNNVALQNSINQRTNQSVPCPTMRVECLDNQKGGETVVFRVIVSGGPISSKPPSYKWRVSAGKVINGQGTPTIMVSTRNIRTSEIEARVKLGGFQNTCPLTARGSVKLVREQ